VHSVGAGVGFGVIVRVGVYTGTGVLVKTGVDVGGVDVGVGFGVTVRVGVYTGTGVLVKTGVDVGGVDGGVGDGRTGVDVGGTAIAVCVATIEVFSAAIVAPACAMAVSVAIMPTLASTVAWMFGVRVGVALGPQAYASKVIASTVTKMVHFFILHLPFNGSPISHDGHRRGKSC